MCADSCQAKWSPRIPATTVPRLARLARRRTKAVSAAEVVRSQPRGPRTAFQLAPRSALPTQPRILLLSSHFPRNCAPIAPQQIPSAARAPLAPYQLLP